jgi:hypothetical protein
MAQDAVQHAEHKAITDPRQWWATVTQTLYRRAGQPHFLLYPYVVGMAVAAVVTLFLLFAHIPHVMEGNVPDVQRTRENFEQVQALFIMTMGMMLCCGALGGCLFDMRGLIQHSANSDFDPHHNASYLLRPFAGAMSGFIVFLVLVGGLFALDIQPPRSNNEELDWVILRRQLPFMAFATLAGYSSHVFMGKLKAISEVIFSMPETEKRPGPATSGPTEATPANVNGNTPHVS